jgi:hypothetical protein
MYRRIWVCGEVEMVGERFGYLVVLRSADNGMFECACDGGGWYCRRSFFLSQDDLRTGNATSCGCLLIGAARAGVYVGGYKDQQEANKSPNRWTAEAVDTFSQTENPPQLGLVALPRTGPPV